MAMIAWPQHEWKTAQARRSVAISTAAGRRADLPWAGLDRLVVTRTGRERCEKLVKFGARIVRHGRYVVFQLAEVAVPHALFVEILRRIDGLRRAPLAA